MHGSSGWGEAPLVLTLSKYLDCGGNYEASALALSVHRSTLKYRLRRIREVSGHDIGHPDVQFNLSGCHSGVADLAGAAPVLTGRAGGPVLPGQRVGPGGTVRPGPSWLKLTVWGRSTAG